MDHRRDGTSGADSAPKTVAREQVERSHPAYGCKFVEEGIDAALDELERRTTDADGGLRAIDIVARGEEVLRTLQVLDLGLDADWFVIDDSRIGALARYECAGDSFRARLVLIQRKGRTWSVVDRKIFATFPLPTLLYHEGNTVTMAAETAGTQHRTSTLLHVRADGGRWKTLFSRDELLDLEVALPGGRVQASWKERGHPLGSEPIFGFEITLPTGASGDVQEPRTTTPSIEALEDFCRKQPREKRIPCTVETNITEVMMEGDTALVQVEGPDTDISCGGESIGSMIAGERYRTIELRSKNGRWSVAIVRPTDRGCAMSVRRLSRLGRSQVGAFIARTKGRAALLQTSDRAQWSDDEALFGAQFARELGDVPLLISQQGDATYWISSESYKLRRLRGDTKEDLAKLDMDASGLAVDAETVYWSSYGRGELRALSAGRERVVAAALPKPMGLAIDGKRVLVATETGIVAVDVQSGAKELTGYGAVAPISIAATNGLVAWVEAGGRVMVTNGAKTRLVADAGHPTQLALVGDIVVWLDAEDRSVRRAYARLD